MKKTKKALFHNNNITYYLTKQKPNNKTIKK